MFGAVGLAASLGACRLLLPLLPERFAVNVPLRHAVLGWSVGAPEEVLRDGSIRVPAGFSIGVFAQDLPNARLLRFTPIGDLLVSTPRSGRIVLLRDADRDGRAETARSVLDGLNRPHGLDLHDGWLYVAETDAIGRARFDAEAGRVTGPFERVVTGLPSGGGHWTRTLRFGPDGWMYVSIGSSCNVCREEDPRRAAIVRYRPDGSGEEIFARGLRNAVGFAWRPETGELLATDNGRDLLGDDFPPCELNRVVQGGFYGWPFANGERVPDPDYGAGREAEIRASIPPLHAFRAHNAPLGIAFLGAEAAVPPAWRGAALVALHGSWNRTRKDGYKVVSLHWGPEGRIVERDFAVGFLRGEHVTGRPVDVAVGQDGAIYVSDDYTGAVYRVAAGEPAERRTPRRDSSRSGSASLATLPAAERSRRMQRGRALWERHACAGCHEAEQATPGVVPFPLAQLGQRYVLGELEAYLAAPTPPMPAPPLDAEQRRDLAVYLLETRS